MQSKSFIKFRLFFNFLQAMEVMVPGVTKERRLEIFTDTLDTMLRDQEINNIEDIDLIFFPIVRSDHIITVVADLKSPAIEIMDNIVSNDDSNKINTKIAGFLVTKLLYVLIRFTL